MKVTFLNRQSKVKNKKFGPFKSVTIMYDHIAGDNNEIAIFDKNCSGMWHIKEDNTKWSEVKIE